MRRNTVASEPVAVASLQTVITDQQTAVIDLPHTRSDFRLAAQAARKGWMKGTRWPTDATYDEFTTAIKERTLTVKERVTLAATHIVEKSEDSRLRAAALSAIIAMEGQNQADELKQTRRVRSRRAQPPDNSVATGVALGLGLGESIADAKREIASRIARLLGVGDDNSGNRIVVEQSR